MGLQLQMYRRIYCTDSCVFIRAAIFYFITEFGAETIAIALLAAIYYCYNKDMGKTLGYSKCWEEKFTIDQFPGTAGLFHSRTGWHGGGFQELASEEFCANHQQSV